MTLPVPEVRARPSVVGRGVPPHVPRGEDRPRVVVVSFPSLLPLPRVCEYAQRSPVFSRRPGPLRLRLSSGGRPPSVSPAKPVGAVCRLSPGRFPVSRPRPERVRGHPALPGVAPRCRVCVGGPAAAPHPLSSARPRPPAWNRGVVSRRGASRGSASVSRRLGGSRRVASPGPGHPSPSSRSSLPLVRPRPAVRCLLAPCGGVSVVTGGSRRSLGRPPPAVLFSLPARVGVPSSVCSARSLAPARLGLARRQAGRPAGSTGPARPASSRFLPG